MGLWLVAALALAGVGLALAFPRIERALPGRDRRPRRATLGIWRHRFCAARWPGPRRCRPSGRAPDPGATACATRRIRGVLAFVTNNCAVGAVAGGVGRLPDGQDREHRGGILVPDRPVLRSARNFAYRPYFTTRWRVGLGALPRACTTRSNAATTSPRRWSDRGRITGVVAVKIHARPLRGDLGRQRLDIIVQDMSNVIFPVGPRGVWHFRTLGPVPEVRAGNDRGDTASTRSARCGRCRSCSIVGRVRPTEYRDHSLDAAGSQGMVMQTG